MANEAAISVSVTIRKTTSGVQVLNYPMRESFNLDVDGTKGPTPRALTIPTGGKFIELGELTTPGVCVLKAMFSNEEEYVEYGIWDMQTDVFYPLGELGPGETWAIKLSRNIQEEYSGTGTGTTSPGNRLFMKSHIADANVSVEVFER